MTPDELREEIEIEGLRLVAPLDYDPNLDHGTIDNRPLLAQCAALLDSLLGGPVATRGIVDEIRRLREELRRSGW